MDCSAYQDIVLRYIDLIYFHALFKMFAFTSSGAPWLLASFTFEGYGFDVKYICL